MNRRYEKAAHLRGFFVWWAHTDLNRGPKDYESCQTAIPKYPETLIEYGLESSNSWVLPFALVDLHPDLSWSNAYKVITKIRECYGTEEAIRADGQAHQ
jgi:hypothetical protein